METASGHARGKYFRSNTDFERRRYQKKRRERQKLKRQQKQVLKRSESTLQYERNLLFPSVKEILLNELKQLEQDSIVGSGAFGQVRIRQWRSMLVAVKTVTGQAASKKIITEAFHLEQCNKYIIHPNVLYFVGVVIPKSSQELASTGASLITELCMIDGESVTLAKLLSGRYSNLHEEILTQGREFEIVLDIVRGLMHIHKAGILHNDLHAGNVLLKKHLGSSRITPVIADFGLSSTFTTSKKYRLAPSSRQDVAQLEFRTKHPHIAPEVIDTNPTTQSDIYSVGYLIKVYCRLFSETAAALKPMSDVCLRSEQHRRPELSEIRSYIITLKRSPTPVQLDH